jgi:hypothetical protein
MSPRYNTRRSGTAETGMEAWLPMYQATPQKSITPDTSAA